MKKKILLLMGIFYLGAINAQVGINTQNPLGIFHIDIKGNTSGATNIKDDIIIAPSADGGVNISIGGAPIASTSIALHSTNKGFLPNRVELQSAIDNTTIPGPMEGMIVYNTKAAGVFPNDVHPGYYQLNNNKWLRLKTSGYLGVSETLTLKSAATTSSLSSTTELTATELDFGTIDIFETGAYSFSFNVAATSSTGTLSDGITQGICFINFLVKKAGTSQFNFATTAEFHPPLFPNGNAFTLSTIKALELEAGDQVKLTTQYKEGYPNITYKAGSTFLVYWQL